MAGVLLLLAGQASAGPPAADPRLSATLVNRLDPGAGTAAESREVCSWQSDFTFADLDGGVSKMSVFDDGSGPALYVGGDFTTAGGVPVNGIARWNGGGWSALSGPSGTGVNGDVYAFAAFDDGSGPALFVGGEFTTAGGVPVNGIARWNGSAWSALGGPSGTGVNGGVYALAVFDDGSGPALYAGGCFTTAGGVTVNNAARWNGHAWSALSGPSGTGVSSCIFALAVFDDGSGRALYAGGEFATAGGVTVNSIARWDGSAWSALSGPSGTGVEVEVVALAVFDDGSGPDLYVGGQFETAGGVTVNGIARWDGSSWSPLSGPSDTGVSGWVYGLAVFDDGSGPDLYTGGYFTTAGGVTVNGIARWDGSAWSALSGPSGTGMNDYVFALAVFDDGSGPALFAGGDFTTAGGVTAKRIARWNGNVWSALTGAYLTGMDYPVHALAVFDDGSGPDLYAGGDFLSAGGVTVDGIARWDGSAWSPLGVPSLPGLTGAFYALAVFDDGSGPALFAGGHFTYHGGLTVNYVAKWDGSAWSALSGPSGTGMNDYVYALAVFDDGSGPALYAGGDFTTAGGVTVNHVARWNGSAWSALSGPSGTGMDGSVHGLAVFDDGSGPALFAGGDFTTAGGVTVNHVALWHGSAWSALSGPSGTGMNGAVNALSVFDDGSGPALSAGGDFTTAGGVTVNYVARWNGSAWSALSGPSGTGMNGAVHALAVIDDGSGPHLSAGGDFTNAGGVTVNHVARWHGSAWSALSGPSGTGMNDAVRALAVFDDGSGPALYAGGDFTTAGGLASNYIAVWRCRSDSIFADGFEQGNTAAWSYTRP